MKNLFSFPPHRSSLFLCVLFAFTWMGCEYVFTHEYLVENATQQNLYVVFSDGLGTQDTVMIPPGSTYTAESFTDEAARVPEALSCLPNRMVDTLIHASGRRVISEFDAADSWIVSDFMANTYQTCLFSLEEEDLE